MTRSPTTFAAFASALALTGALACASPEPPPPPLPPPPPKAQLAVHDAWARAADSGATSAVYFMLTNTADVADTLVGATTGLADQAGMHMSMQQGGTMHMAALRALPVPANDSVWFAPLGAHLMLTGMHRALVEGDTAVVTLTFGSGQVLEVRAGVRKR